MNWTQKLLLHISSCLVVHQMLNTLLLWQAFSADACVPEVPSCLHTSRWCHHITAGAGPARWLYHQPQHTACGVLCLVGCIGGLVCVAHIQHQHGSTRQANGVADRQVLLFGCSMSVWYPILVARCDGSALTACWMYSSYVVLSMHCVPRWCPAIDILAQGSVRAAEFFVLPNS